MGFHCGDGDGQETSANRSGPAWLRDDTGDQGHACPLGRATKSGNVLGAAGRGDIDQAVAASPSEVAKFNRTAIVVQAWMGMNKRRPEGVVHDLGDHRLDHVLDAPSSAGPSAGSGLVRQTR